MRSKNVQTQAPRQAAKYIRGSRSTTLKTLSEPDHLQLLRLLIEQKRLPHAGLSPYLQMAH
jgi:hypothetical protein